MSVQFIQTPDISTRRSVNVDMAVDVESVDTQPAEPAHTGDNVGDEENDGLSTSRHLRADEMIDVETVSPEDVELSLEIRPPMPSPPRKEILAEVLQVCGAGCRPAHSEIFARKKSQNFVVSDRNRSGDDGVMWVDIGATCVVDRLVFRCIDAESMLHRRIASLWLY